MAVTAVSEAQILPPPTVRPPSPPTAYGQTLLVSVDRRSVRGGTFERLLKWVAIEQHDVSRVRAFLYAFRAHTTTAEMWASVVRLEESVSSVGDKSAVHNFIREWVLTCYEADFKTRTMVKELLDFTTSSMSLREANQIKLICVQRDQARGAASVIRRVSGLSTLSATNRCHSTSSVNTSSGSSGSGSHIGRSSPPSANTVISASPPVTSHSPHPLSIFAISKTDILAGSLTVHVAEQISRVQITEFIGQAWQKPQKARLAPGLTALSDHWNNISFWVAWEILSVGPNARIRDTPEAKENVHQQAKRLKKAIKVLHRCIELHNYHDAIAIVSGLNLACVQRLKRVWAALEPNTRALFDEVDELLQPNNNWAHYREALRSLQARPNTPVIPYVALFLRDLTFVQDGNPDTLPEGKHLLNWEKIELFGNQVAQFIALRKVPHMGLMVDKRCQAALLQLTAPDEEALMRKSEECEPRKLLPGELPTIEEVEAKEWLTWTVNDVAVWAGKIIGGMYTEIFRAGAIDGPKLATIDDLGLVELGVQKLGLRKRLLRSVQRLREKVKGDDDSSESQSHSARSPHLALPGSGPNTLRRDSLSGPPITRDANLPNAPIAWSEADVQRWLDVQGEGDAKSQFVGVTGITLITLDADAIERMGVDKLGQRKRLARKIADLREQSGVGTVERSISAPVVSTSVNQAPLRMWTDVDLLHWLELNELGEYSRVFTQQHVIASKLLELSEEQITKLGITKLGHRKRFMRMLDELRSSHGVGPQRLPSNT